MEAIRWDGEALHLLDQRALPTQHRWLSLRSWEAVAEAITDMVVRGAPAIGITAAYGMVLAARAGVDREVAKQALLAARPTAVNLRWALQRLDTVPGDNLEREAIQIHEEDRSICRRLGMNGAELLSGGVLTICNTGALATGGHGTALGMVRSALENGRSIHVYALETRPYLQGARLTATECATDGIPYTLIADGMAGALMRSGKVSAVVVGCDRVTANGDTANKIGTYGLAVLARHHEIPFYVAMPLSTLDPTLASGDAIPIEEREATELRTLAGIRIAPEDSPVWNPAFDITPAELITAWVTEDGLWTPPSRTPLDAPNRSR